MKSHNGAPEPPLSQGRKEELLDSWKEIAAYLGRDLTTVQRWEKREGLPIHRQIHSNRATVYAYRSEIDSWLSTRRQQEPSDSLAPTGSRRWMVIPLPIVMGLVLLAGMLWWFILKLKEPQTQALDFKETWVLLTRFDNRTGESVFDGTLEYLLRQELEDSSQVRVLSREQIQDSLRLMKKPGESPIDRRLGTEICRRAGNVGAMLAGSLDKLGSAYRLKVELVDPVSGDVLAANQQEAKSSELVLPALRSLSYWVRESLGEKTAGYHPGEDAGETLTPSRLRALHLYSRAVESWRSGHWERMLTFSREAVKEDLDLGVAHIYLAWALRGGAENRKEFSHHLQRAFQLADKSTETERQWILGSYYDLQGDPEKAAEHYETLLALDPNNHDALSNLTQYCSGKAHRDERWIGKVLQYTAWQAELRHDSGRIQWVCAWRSAYWDDLSQAQKFVDRTRELLSNGAELEAVQTAWIELFPAYRQWLAGNPETALLEVDRVARTLSSRAGDESSTYTWMVGTTYLAMGRLQAGEQLLNGLQGSDVRVVPLALGAAALLREDKPTLRRVLNDALVRPGPVTVILLARLGLLSRAEEAREKWLARFVSSKMARSKQQGNIRIIEGALALARGQTVEAIEALEEGLKKARDSSRAPAYLGAESLARIWLEQGKTEKARQVLERNSHHLEKVHAIFLAWEAAPLFWMRLRMQLAELYHKTGREQEAREVEVELSKLLSHADPDHPFLIALAERQKDRVGSD